MRPAKLFAQKFDGKDVNARERGILTNFASKPPYLYILTIINYIQE